MLVIHIIVSTDDVAKTLQILHRKHDFQEKKDCVNPKSMCKRPKSLCQTYLVMHMRMGYFTSLLPSQESCSRNTSDSVNAAATEQENANPIIHKAQS